MSRTSDFIVRTNKFIDKTESFMDRNEMRRNNQKVAIKNIETQFRQFTEIISNMTMGASSSNTEVTAKPTYEQCKAIMIRSGKQLDDPRVEKPQEKQSEPHAAAAHGQPTMEAPQTEAQDIRLPPPFPERLKQQKKEHQLKKFLDILKQVHIIIPLVEAIQNMPNYAKYLKDMVSKRRRIGEFETIVVTKECMAMIHNKVPPQRTDPGIFIIPCKIGNNHNLRALCDLGASNNMMPKAVFNKLGIGKEKPTSIMLHLADHSFVQSEGEVEDIILRVGNFIFPTGFLILDSEADENAPIILGRPFLATSRTLIDVENGELIMRVDNQNIKIHVLHPMKSAKEKEVCQDTHASKVNTKKEQGSSRQGREQGRNKTPRSKMTRLDKKQNTTSSGSGYVWEMHLNTLPT
ncbi:hypothetical protein HRI_000082700 [Hibiscus trionum]|uniref:Aspartic peptidase DDI1-type domain-containing protein n=1 Tax=Hibiscus trionum TaxID=183268 RepID=A0A9W7GR26_HIBTR|nr:hypothetical protein HRI_000082700 [Hibiscus trionum]